MPRTEQLRIMQEDRYTGTGDGLPIVPSIDVAVTAAITPPSDRIVPRRFLTLAGLAIGLGIAGGIVAWLLVTLIALITNLVFTGRIDLVSVEIEPESVGPTVLVIPVLGALVIGLMARFGSPAIRGHGIPEVMEKVLRGDSRIPPRLMFLKPLSAALAIGTGGPFGAEGPIIATGGALGSAVGQAIRITSDERKTLLAAGAAAGMAATFGTPVSAVLLAIELLLFEYRARSIIPVALAASAATGTRMILFGPDPVFPMAPPGDPRWTALVAYVLVGATIGLVAVGVTRLVYEIEDGFARLPIHWMWWPAIGAVAVGVCGFIDPRILGVGYDHIVDILSGELIGTTLLWLVCLKLVAWSVYLGSGTSGGTLAPLFIIGGGLGATLGALVADLIPTTAVSVPVAGLVGMAAMFAGASHALLASIVFAFEATRQPLSLLPLLAGCSAAYLISVLLMRTSIMTERLARRGTAVRPEYALDFLTQVLVSEAMTTNVRTLDPTWKVSDAREWLDSEQSGGHNGFPVVDGDGRLLGVLTRRDLFGPAAASAVTVAQLLRRPPVVALPNSTLREAADHMVRESVGRLPVVDEATGALVGIVSRSDLLAAHAKRLRAQEVSRRVLRPYPRARSRANRRKDQP